MNLLPYYFYFKRGKKYVLCYGLYGARPECRKIQRVSAAHRDARGRTTQRVVEGPFGLMGFGRLAIMGLTPEGMQPFYRGADLRGLQR